MGIVSNDLKMATASKSLISSCKCQDARQAKIHTDPLIVFVPVYSKDKEKG